MSGASQCFIALASTCVKNTPSFGACFACPAGWHATGFSCDAACLTCQNGGNRAQCEQDSPLFWQCEGTACPAGYLQTQTGFLIDCPGSSPNAVQCKQ